MRKMLIISGIIIGIASAVLAAATFQNDYVDTGVLGGAFALTCFSGVLVGAGISLPARTESK
jgi:hypothetical protein